MSVQQLEEDASGAGERPRFVQDPNIWLDDGNIVIAAGNDPTLLFKCHRSVLCKHSDVFDGMFSLPISDAVEQYDGVPLVQLPDPAEDVRALLGMLYDPSTIPFQETRMTRFDKLAGPLRLAKKYQMTGLMAQLTSMMDKDRPNSLQDWLHIRNVMASEGFIINWSDEDFRELNCAAIFPDPGPIFVLARQLKLNDVLPMVFYDLQMWYPASTTSVVGPKELRKVAPLQPLHITDDEFSAEDLQEFVMMKDAFDRALNQRLWELRRVMERWSCKFDAAREIEGSCADVICVELKDKWTLMLGDQRHVVPRAPIETMHSFEQDIGDCKGICHGCAEELGECVIKLQNSLWTDLSGITTIRA